MQNGIHHFAEEIIDILSSDDMVLKKNYFVNYPLEIPELIQAVETGEIKLEQDMLDKIRNGVAKFKVDLDSEMEEADAQEPVVIDDNAIQSAMQNNERTKRFMKALNESQEEINRSIQEVKHPVKKPQENVDKTVTPSVLITSGDFTLCKILQGSPSKAEINKCIIDNSILNARVFSLKEIPTSKESLNLLK